RPSSGRALRLAGAPVRRGRPRAVRMHRGPGATGRAREPGARAQGRRVTHPEEETMPEPWVLLEELGDMPRQLERTLRLVPSERLAWRPGSWDGCPSETFSAVEQVCHLRDIERDGYHVRIRRMLAEPEPSLVSIDSYALAHERAYEGTDPEEALAAFR